MNLGVNAARLTMTTPNAGVQADFHRVLAAPGRWPEIPESADANGWLIGSWELEVCHYLVDVSERHLKGEAHLGWTGGALQQDGKTWKLEAEFRQDNPAYPEGTRLGTRGTKIHRALSADRLTDTTAPWVRSGGRP